MKYKIHLNIKKKDGFSDYSACNNWASYLGRATNDRKKVTCKSCLRCMKGSLSPSPEANSGEKPS